MVLHRVEEALDEKREVFVGFASIPTPIE